MNTVTVTCTKAAKQTKSGWVFDVVLPDGQTAAVWANAKTDINQFSAVAVGDQVELAVGNTPGKYFYNKTVQHAPAGTPPQPYPQAPVHPFPAADPMPSIQAPERQNRADEIRDYVAKHAKLFKVCLRAAKEEMADDLAEAEAKSVATTLYIQTVRKFGL